MIIYNKENIEVINDDTLYYDESLYKRYTVDHEKLDNLYSIIRDHGISIDGYFKAGEDFKDFLPYLYWRNPLIINISNDIINSIHMILILNNIELKWADIISSLTIHITNSSVSGYGQLVDNDSLMNIIENYIYSRKIYGKDYGYLLISLIDFVNATIPKEQRMNEKEIEYFLTKHFGKRSELDKGSYLRVLSNPIIINKLETGTSVIRNIYGENN